MIVAYAVRAEGSMGDVSARLSALSPEKRALLSKRLRAAGEAPRRLSTDPVAVIGMGCRFPGGAAAPASFWRLLAGGVDAISEVPPDRWDAAALYDPDARAPGKASTRWGGFVDGIDQFDASFFGISPREAARMDPKQRLLLEVVWEALDDAGLSAARLRGRRAGVFVAVYQSDYSRLAVADAAAIDGYSGTGAQQCLAANRISYLLDLRGPSLVVDTACSSSLVAVHLACRSLLARECDLAVVGAVSLLLLPEESIAMSKLGMMAADGRCKTFDARADGFVRGEGAGAVVLRRLSDVLADGDDALALVRGTAMNQDGRTNGLTAPNGLAQQDVIRLALDDAGVSPADISYVETHGTGTPLGDPIEVEALREVFGQRSGGRPCVLGAVKTNLGHLEAAAGMAGLIKVVLSLRHGEIPPNLHLVEPNPRLPLEGAPFVLPVAAVPWPAGAGPRLAGVSSFGMGGTNAHVIVEEAPSGPPRRAAAIAGRAELLALSAHSEGALRALARAHLDAAGNAPPPAPPLAELFAAAALRRTHHDHRLAVVARSRDELAERLRAFLQGEERPGTAAGRARPGAPPRIVFVFSGQGSQWLGMGRGLLAGEPVFRAAIERCDHALRASEGWSILDELAAGDGVARLDRVEVLQPVLFAVQTALCALVRSLGVEPDAVVGHSMGEVAAAHAAGVLDLDDAVRIIARRSRLLSRVRGRGAMLAVELGAGEAEELVAGAGGAGGVAVAAENGPTSTVLSGEDAAIDAIAGALERRGVSCRRIKVDVASHGPAMDALRADILDALADLRPRPAAVPIYSTVTGAIADGRELDADYWAKNLRQPVLFWPAVQRLAADGHEVFLELGPHPALLAPIEQGLHHLRRKGVVLPSMRRDEDERGTLLGSLGALYTMGLGPRWEELFREGAPRIALPAYPWQPERFPLPRPSGTPPGAGGSAGAPSGHPLLGARLDPAHLPGTHVWEAALDAPLLSFLADHRVQGAAVLPGTATVEIAIAAAREALGATSPVLEGVAFEEPVFISGEGAAIQIALSVERPGAAVLRVHGRASSGAAWALHARGTVLSGEASPAPRTIDLERILDRCPEEIPGPDFYARLAGLGNVWGPAFQGIRRLRRGHGEALVEVAVPAEIEADVDRYGLHPAVLDAFGQALGVVADVSPSTGPAVLAALGRVVVHGRLGARMWGHLTLREDRRGDGVTGDLLITDPSGRVAVEITGVRLQRLHRSSAEDAPARSLDGWLYEVRWEPKDLAVPQAVAPRGGFIVHADRAGVGDRLVALLEAAGERAVLIEPPACGSAPDDLARALDEAIGPFAEAPWQVVYLGGLDASPPDGAGAAEVEAAVLASAGGALHWIQALGRRVPCHRLSLITRGAQPASPGRTAAAQAPLWGLGRVISAEQPERLGALVDLAPGTPIDEAAAQILGELRAGDGEGEVAYREGRRLVARLVRRHAPLPARSALHLLPDRSYLVTGGLGDLGLLVARRLIERGARHLVLLGRGGLPPRRAWKDAAAGSPVEARARAVRGLEALGASVHVEAVDVGDEAALGAFLAAFEGEGRPPIRGVVHCAGVHLAASIDDLGLEAMAADLHGKVRGAWALHRALGALDFFVLFSSAATLLGSPFLGSYAAANAFLDALAHDRRALGLPAISIDWGFWSEVGMAARGEREHGRSFAPRGAYSFTPEQGLDALERLIVDDPVQVAVMPIDWPTWRAFYPAAAAVPLLTGLVAGEAGAAAHDDQAPALTRDALLGAPRDDRARLLEGYLRRRVAGVLRSAVARVELDQPLTRMGLDSLMAVELKNRIEADLGLRVPIVDVLGCPGLARLAEQLEGMTAAAPQDGWEEISL
jgi:myxalamid-type polyketide synthase MxaE and MxaD